MTEGPPARSRSEPPPPRAVLFDAGFTLVLPRAPVVETYVAHARHLGLSGADEAIRDSFAAAWRGAHSRHQEDDLRSSDARERAAWWRLTRAVAAPVPGLLDIHEAWLDALIHHFNGSNAWVVAPHAVTVLDRLRAAGLRVGVVSNWHSALHRIIAALELSSHLDFVLTSSDVGWRKPHPAIFETALRTAGSAAAETIHVGDSHGEDALGARRAGMRALWLTNSDLKPAGERTSAARVCSIGGLPEVLDHALPAPVAPLADAE